MEAPKSCVFKLKYCPFKFILSLFKFVVGLTTIFIAVDEGLPMPEIRKLVLSAAC